VPAPGMAAADALDGQPAALGRPMHFQRLDPIGRAGGRIAASRPQQRRYQKLVGADQDFQKVGGRAHGSLRVGGVQGAHTFKRRSEVLQQQSEGPDQGFGPADDHIIVIFAGLGGENPVGGGLEAPSGPQPGQGLGIENPALIRTGTSLEDQAWRGGFAAGARQSQELGPLLQAAELAHGKLGRQPLAALGAAAVDDAAATDGGHAGAKAVAAGADDLAGLKSALHGTSP